MWFGKKDAGSLAEQVEWLGGFKFRSEHPHRTGRSRMVGWQGNDVS
jgi:hypothetical protein